MTKHTLTPQPSQRPEPEPEPEPNPNPNPNSHPDCTVIVPNYNGDTLLRQNLATVIAAAQRYPGRCEVLVVDDASSDNSVAYIQTLGPQVRLIRHSQNQGFASAVHSGVAESRSELIMLLNTDVRIQADCLNQLAHVFSDPLMFAASPVIVGQNTQLLPNTWVRPQLRGGHIASMRWTKESLYSQANAGLHNTLYCSGGSMMLRRSMFVTLGGFSAIFEPFYSEDFDLGMRAWYQGWASVVSTQAQVVHQDKGAIETHYTRGYIKSVQRRNRLLLEAIHLPLPYLLLVNIPVVLLQVVGELFLLDKKNLKGFAAALKRLPQAAKIRATLKASRQLDFRRVLERANAPYTVPLEKDC